MQYVSVYVCALLAANAMSVHETPQEAPLHDRPRRAAMTAHLSEGFRCLLEAAELQCSSYYQAGKPGDILVPSC